MEQFETQKGGTSNNPGAKEDQYNRAKTRRMERRGLLTIAELEEANKKLIERAERQLDEIGPSLLDLTNHIKQGSPDCVVFLDKGARILASPIRRYLLKDGNNRIPDFLFLNDNQLKYKYLVNDKEFLRGISEEKYKQFKNKKMFFVDETFSVGTGAATLKIMVDNLGIDAKFFSLSVELMPSLAIDPDEPEYVDWASLDRHFSILGSIESDPRFVLYKNFANTLFTKEAASLYVADSHDFFTEEETHTVPRYSGEHIDDDEAYSNQVKKINMRTVQELKNMIYETLIREEGEQNNVGQ